MNARTFYDIKLKSKNNSKYTLDNKDGIIMNKVVWKFILDGETKVLEVKIDDLAGKVSMVLNDYNHYIGKLSPFKNWQDIPFEIEEHKCNFIYTTGMLLDEKHVQLYDLIIDDYSVVSGELYNFPEHKKKYLTMFYIQFFRTCIGVVVGAFFSGYMLATMTKGIVKFLLNVCILMIGYYAGIKFFDLFAYIFKLITKSRKIDNKEI